MLYILYYIYTRKHKSCLKSSLADQDTLMEWRLIFQVLLVVHTLISSVLQYLDSSG